jgi:FkbM family methyltransferase
MIKKPILRMLLKRGRWIKRVGRLESEIRSYQLDHPNFSLVQIGAHNGFTGDPFCRFLIEDWWSAVLVEPQARYYDVLREVYSSRRNVICRRVAIAAHDGHVTLYRLADTTGLPWWAGQLATLNYEALARHRNSIPGIEQQIVSEEVESVTLPTLLAQCGLTRFDLLAVDTEASDYEIIQQIDRLDFRPPLIYYEHAHLAADQRAACEAFLEGRGYRVSAITALDSLAIHRA